MAAFICSIALDVGAKERWLTNSGSDEMTVFGIEDSRTKAEGSRQMAEEWQTEGSAKKSIFHFSLVPCVRLSADLESEWKMRTEK
jgi:hypothetical protein